MARPVTGATEPDGAVALAQVLRASAACVQAVLAGQSLTECLAAQPSRLRPATQAISFHVMRRLGFARAARAQLLHRAPAAALDALLLVGLSLLETALAHEADGTPARRGLPVYAPHTLVNQCVQASKPKLARFAGLVNATLRNYIRQRDALRQRLAHDMQAVWNYPLWWIEQVQAAYPVCWQALLAAGNQPAPMMLRVNRRRADVPAVMQAFAAAGLESQHLGDEAIALLEPRAVQALPGFAEGLWSVQDSAAQRAAHLLPVTDGARVLDACAAPGGKTAHLLERAALDLLALDADRKRLDRVAENLRRLGLDGPGVRLCCADARARTQWWDGRPFDAVLADVPCTASGVVRRHPDIRWLRRPEDIARTVALQAEILDSLWPVLRPGGHLLLVTCSIFPQEGEEQAVAFLQRHADARRLPAPGQMLPLQEPGAAPVGDGFFYALFVKAELGNRDTY